MIVAAPSTPPINSVIWINKSEQSMWSMAVKVRELNVTQELGVHWRLVNKDDMTPPFFSADLLPQGDQALRDLPFDVQSDTLRDNECARLDLAVSGSFIKRSDPGLFAETKNDENTDIAQASWWIWEGLGQADTSMTEKAHIAASCPTDETLLVLPTATATNMVPQP
jgi:hypothetical protein